MADLTSGQDVDIISPLNTTTPGTSDSGVVTRDVPQYSTGGTPATVSVTNSATLISALNASRKKIVICNTSTTLSVYLGGSGVTAAAGIQLPPLSVFTDSMPFTGTQAIYGITSSGSADIRVQEWA